MFEKRKRLRVRSILEKQFTDFKELDQVVKAGDLVVDRSASKTVFFDRSTNERNMTRKTRSRQFHSAFQSGYCAVCHIPYSSLEDHIQSKRHLKLIGEDGNYISIKGFDSFLALDGIDALEVNDKSCDYSLYQRRSKMPRTRTSSVMYDRAKESPLSPVGSDSGHHLRSRKNINYMTPPLEEDSLTEKPEVVKEYRELRSSTRLLAKLTEQMVTDSDDVWNSGRPKRSCNKQRISADERLVVDNKSYYKVEVLPTKLRSGVGGAVPEKRADTPIEEDDKGSRAIKKRNSELIRLNNEAENFLFPKKQDSSDDENEEDQKTKPITHEEVGANKTVKVENDESTNNTCSESKIKKKRRTHAELFISENQKYYKFETPGSSSRLRYQGSYLAVGNKSKNNGESSVKTESKEAVKSVDSEENEFTLNLDDYNFSFENVPRSEDWYQAFERLDTGEEKYSYLNDDNYWDSMILPYQLDYVPPLDPNECLTQYNQIKKCLLEPPSTSTSVTCSTPDPNASNSSMDAPFDDDSKISATENSSNSSAMEEIRPRRHKRKLKGAFHAVSSNGKNPRKSPRQHASTLAILSSLIHQRKKKAAARKSDLEKRNLSTIEEEPKTTAKKTSAKEEMDYSTITKNFEDEIAAIYEDQEDLVVPVEIDFGDDEEISFNGRFSVEDVFNLYESSKNVENNSPRKRLLHAKPGRKPGKRKKNRTGWPMNRARRISKRGFIAKDEEMEHSAVESVAADSNESGEEGCEEGTHSIDDSIMDSGKDSELGKLNSENNNKNDQSSLGDVNIDDTTTNSTNCDLNNSDDRVGRNNDNSKGDDNGSEKVLTTKVNNNGDTNNIEYLPIVCVQKLEKGHIDNKSDNNTNNSRRSSSPKRTNRGQRRMPASPKSPRMLRRPRGRWYRER